MNATFGRTQRRNRRHGLTLIELVMVLIILIALTALIVPIVDSLRRTSDKSSGAAGMKQIVENVSLFRAMKGNYPNQFDSLLLDDSASGTPTGEYLAVKANSKYEMLALTSNEATSLTKIGIASVMDHDPDSPAVYRSLPGNSGVVERPIASGGLVPIITNLDIVRSMYPDEAAVAASSAGEPGFHAATGTIGLSSGITVRLVALGVGPSNTAVGKTMVSAPAYQGVDGLTEYNRFIAVFAVYDGNINTQKRAQLKGALDSGGDFLNQELNEVDENSAE